MIRNVISSMETIPIWSKEDNDDVCGGDVCGMDVSVITGQKYS